MALRILNGHEALGHDVFHHPSSTTQLKRRPQAWHFPSSGSHKVVYVALGMNPMIAIAKFLAAEISGSSVMLSEGMHSSVDAVNELLLPYGLYRAQIPPVRTYPFGHGRGSYFWISIVALLVPEAGVPL